MELEKFGVVEMTAQEKTTENGGFIQFIVGAIVGGLIYDIISDPQGAASAFSDGYHSQK